MGLRRFSTTGVALQWDLAWRYNGTTTVLDNWRGATMGLGVALQWDYDVSVVYEVRYGFSDLQKDAGGI
jgi:hypothetical protein